MRPRSYVGAAYVVWLLYLFGYIGGAVGNILCLALANRNRRATGVSPRGRESLVFLLVTHFMFPVVLVLSLLSVRVLYRETNIFDGWAAPIVSRLSATLDRVGSIFESAPAADIQPETVRRFVPLPTPTRIDPWIAAVSKAAGVLHDAPAFEHDLQAHQQSARQVSEQISAVERARPLLATVATIKSKGLPLVGNAWGMLIRALNATRPGAGDALDSLVEFLDEISAMKARLDGLPSVDPVIVATGAFRNQPSRERLAAMDDAMQSLRGGLSPFDEQLSGYLEQVDSVLNSLNLLREGLQGASSKVPQLSDPIRTIDGAVAGLARPVRDLQAGMQEWHREIRSCMEVMGSVHQIVAAVKE